MQVSSSLPLLLVVQQIVPIHLHRMPLSEYYRPAKRVLWRNLSLRLDNKVYCE
jgi:hypothetical protein